MRLLTPRKRNHPKDHDRQGRGGRGGAGDPEAEGSSKAPPKTEDELQHENDKRKLIQLLDECKVDLITVAANCLEARYLKKELKSITQEYMNQQSAASKNSNNAPSEDSQDHHSSRDQRDRCRTSQGRGDLSVRKEILTIWGRTEIPKLFSISHNS